VTADGRGQVERGQVELVAEGVRVSRGGVEILRGVDLTVRGGERLALTGPSGSGKTVLLSVLAGLARPESGTVLLDARPLAQDPALRRRMGVVFQGYGLVALLTAVENVELPLLASGVPAADARGRARDALEAVGLGDRAGHLVEELSGGQQQRAAVARALVVRPDVLLADEPTAEQDVGHRAATLDAILATAATGTAVVLATHDPVVAARCDRVVHLDAGVLGGHAP
jgi:putative ABC transport system ATP-binding protein